VVLTFVKRRERERLCGTECCVTGLYVCIMYVICM
jgi:hypothetical protein